jgi:Outer membrane protein (porin)
MNNKVNALTIALLSVISSSAFANTELYKSDAGLLEVIGRAYAGHIFGDESKSEFYGSNSFLRIGLNGESAINKHTKAIGYYELQQFVFENESAIAENANSLRVRYAYAGVKHDQAGAVTYGRQNGAAALISDWTDVALTNPYGGNANGTNNDKFGTDRSSDVLKYSGIWGGFQLDTSYKFRNKKDGQTTTTSTVSGTSVTSSTSYSDKDNDNSAYGITATYTFPINLSVGTNYSIGKQGSYDDAKLWVTGVKFDDKATYAAFIYGDGKDWYAPGYDHKGYETALGYNFKSGFGVLALWNLQKTTQNSTGKETDTVNYYTLGGLYKFNKNLRFVAEYRFNNKKADAFNAQVDSTTGLKVDASDDFALALRYDF